MSQSWVLITRQLKLDEDSKYLVNILTMNIVINKDDITEYYMDQQEKVQIGEDLPDDILDSIRNIRLAALREILSTCNNAFKAALLIDQCPTKKSASCAATRIGILIKGLQPLGLYPPIDDAALMYGCVRFYWEGLKAMRAKYEDYGDDEVYSSRKKKCSFELCFRPMEILGKARNTLKKYAHPGLWAQWESSGYTKVPM